MAKCNTGKGCGGSCISVPYSCQLELGPGEADKLDKMADLLLNRNAAIRSPQQAVAYLEQNKAGLALAGKGNYGDPNAEILVVGLEPGDGAHIYFKDADKSAGLQPRHGGISVDTPEGENAVSFVNRNPVLVANETKVGHEMTMLYGKAGEINIAPAMVGKANMMPSLYDADNMPTSLSGMAARPGNRYGKNLSQLFEGTGLNSVGNINPNPVGLPQEGAWPFKNLPLAKGSVFSSREKWLGYVRPILSDGLVSKLSGSSNAKVVFIGGAKKIHNKLFDSMAKSAGSRVVNAPILSTSSSGRPKRTALRYYVTKEGKLVMQTKHPSAPTWSNAEKKAVNKVLRDYREAVRRAKLEGREGDAERLLETMQQL